MHTIAFINKIRIKLDPYVLSYYSEKKERMCLVLIQAYLCMSAELSPELRQNVPLSLPVGGVILRVLTPRVAPSRMTGTPVQLFC